MKISMLSGAVALAAALAGSGWSQETPPAAGASETGLRYLGHASFEIVPPGGDRIVIDPYQNAWFSHWFDAAFPEVESEVVISTHSHFDHGASDAVRGNPRVMDHAGALEGRDYSVRAIEGLHAKPERYGTENRIVLIETGGVRIVHWGDNGAELSEQLRRELSPVDILILPIDDSEHVLAFEEADAVRAALNPRVLIPVHYYIPGLTSPCSTLEPPEEWLSRRGTAVRRIGSGTVRIPSDLPGVPEVWLFGVPDRSHAPGPTAALPCRFQAAGPWLALTGLLLGTGTIVIWGFRRRG